MHPTASPPGLTTRYHRGMQDAAQTFVIAPSYRLKLAVAALHVLAAGAVWLAGLAGWLQLVVAGGLAGRLAWWWRGYLGVTLRAQPDGSLAVLTGETEQAVELLPDSMVLAWLAVLRYRLPGRLRAHAVVVLPDSLDTEAFRRLRVWMKWRARVGRMDVDRSGATST